jgi:hypothetical protein
VSPDECRADVKIEDRKFSSMDSEGNCSGFYTQLSDNSLLNGAVRDVAKQYCVQAKSPILQSGEMGFYVFCDPVRKSVALIEGFFYGDERLSSDEITKPNHSFKIYDVD